MTRPTGIDDLIRLLRGLRVLERESFLARGELDTKKLDILSKRMREN
jgi:hypothetical protein